MSYIIAVIYFSLHISTLFRILSIKLNWCLWLCMRSAYDHIPENGRVGCAHQKKRGLWKLILGEDISIIAWFAIIDNQGPKSHLLHSKPVTYFVVTSMESAQQNQQQQKTNQTMMTFMHEVCDASSNLHGWNSSSRDVPKTFFSESLFSVVVSNIEWT